MDPQTLTELELQVLAFEKRSFRYQGAKEQAIKDEFGMSAARYYQLLVNVIRKPEALAHDPVTVHRMQRLTTRSHAG